VREGGKYTAKGARPEGQGRLEKTKDSPNPAFTKIFTERNWKIVDELVAASTEIGRPPAQVALDWITKRLGVTSTIIGATKLEQLEDDRKSLEFVPEAIAKRLDAVSEPELVHPYRFFREDLQAMIPGGTKVRARPSWWR